MVEDILEVGLVFYEMFGQILISLFGLGLSYYLNRGILSSTLFTYSLFMFLLFTLYANSVMIYIALASVVAGFVLKYIGG